MHIMKAKTSFKNILSKNKIYVILIGAMILLSILEPKFFSFNNIINLLRQISVNGIVAMGMMLVIISNGIDLGSGSVLAFSSVIVASLAQEAGASQKYFETMGALPALIPIALAILVGAACGFSNGVIIAKTGIPPFIATLGMQLLARGATYIYTNGQPISGLTEEFKVLGKGSVFGILPVPVLVFFIVVFVTWIILRKRQFGSSIYAIGGNVNAATVSGIDVTGTIIKVYTYAGLLCGVAACVNTARVGNAQASVGTGYEFDAIIACVVGGISQKGGIGTVGGCVAGILLYGVIANGMNMLGISPYWQNVVKGIVIVVSVILDTKKNNK